MRSRRFLFFFTSLLMSAQLSTGTGCTCDQRVDLSADNPSGSVEQVDPSALDDTVVALEVEPNHTVKKATALEPGIVKAGQLSPKDVDVFAVPALSEAQVATVVISQLETVEKLTVDWLDTEGRRLLSTAFTTTTTLPNLSGRGDGRYLKLRLNTTTTAAVRYRISVSIRSAEANEEIEMNDRFDRASDLLLGEEVHGYIGWRNDSDWYHVSLRDWTAEDRVSVDVDGVDTVPLRLSLLSAEEVVLQSRSASAGQSVRIANVAVPPATRSVFVRVQSGRQFDPSLAYALRVNRFTSGTESLEREPNDVSGSQMTPLPLDTIMSGVLADTHDIDCYAVSQLVGSGLLTVKAVPSPGVDVACTITDALGLQVGSASSAGLGGLETARASIIGSSTHAVAVCLRAVKVLQADLPNRYRVMATFDPAQPEMDSTAVTHPSSTDAGVPPPTENTRQLDGGSPSAQQSP